MREISANLGGFSGWHNENFLSHHQALQRSAAHRVLHRVLHHWILHDGSQRIVRGLRFCWQQVLHIVVIYRLRLQRSRKQQKDHG